MRRTTKARKFVVGVGENIRGERRRQEMRQKALAKKLGIDVPTMSRIESGGRDLRLSELYEVGTALGVPPRVLVDVPNGNGSPQSS